jgi:hypothetical protein
LPLPTSAANLVLAKSSGYTNNNEVAPAAPPEARFPKKNFQNSFFGSYGQKIFLYVSLNAKFSA